MANTEPFPLIPKVGASVVPRVGCYVALGDSFTAGTGCRRDYAWADRMAAWLKLENPKLVYENLAVAGARSAEVAQQLPRALQLEPDLVSVVCGVNDALFSVRVDPLAYARNLSAVVRVMKRAVGGVTIVTATAPESWKHLDLRPLVTERLERSARRLNQATRGVASAYGLGLVDIAAHPALAERESFAADGLHPSEYGHAVAAQAFIDELAGRCP